MSTIFVVDDEKEIADLLSGMFKKQGLDSLPFYDAPTLVKSLQNVKCHMIVADVKMPGMDGFQLFQLVHKLYPYKAPPIACITGHTDSMTKVKQENLGVKIFRKPDMYVDLLNHVLDTVQTEPSVSR